MEPPTDSFFTVSSADLHRLLYNLILFSDKKSLTGGAAFLHASDGRLYGFATDDHIAFADWIPVDLSGWFGDDDILFTLSLENMKISEKDLRTTVATRITYFDDFVENNLPEDLRETVVGLCVFHGFDPAGAAEDRFALNPERLRKFTLVKFAGKESFPIDCRPGWSNILDREVIGFKIGPTAQGVIATLDRDVLKEVYGDQPVFMA